MIFSIVKTFRQKSSKWMSYNILPRNHALYYQKHGLGVEDKESPSKKFWRHKNEGWGEEEWERKPLKNDV